MPCDAVAVMRATITAQVGEELHGSTELQNRLGAWLRASGVMAEETYRNTDLVCYYIGRGESILIKKDGSVTIRSNRLGEDFREKLLAALKLLGNRSVNDKIIARLRAKYPVANEQAIKGGRVITLRV